MRSRLAALAVLAVSAAGPGHAYMAQNGMVVEPRDAGSFHVRWSGMSGAPRFWCAAGDYAMHSLGLPGNAQLYRYDAPGRRAGEGITFGLDAARAERTGLLRLQGGRGVLAAHARQFCFTRAGGRDR